MQRRWNSAARRLELLLAREDVTPPASAYETRVIADLNTEGVHVTTVDHVLSQSGRRAIADASEMVESGKCDDPAIWRQGQSSLDLTGQPLLAHIPGIYLLGLDPSMLRIVQLYLRLHVAYHGAVIRHSLVDQGGVGTRLWHQDAEDLNVLRAVIYLNDVEEGGGPFEYIPRNSGLSYGSFSGVSGPLTNERMLEVMPFNRWKRCFGPAGTIVLCDTAKVFHHESLQTARDRFVVMMGYSTRRPTGMKLAMSHFPVEMVQPTLQRLIPPENNGHVFDWRRPTT